LSILPDAVARLRELSPAYKKPNVAGRERVKSD
jgi:hypothetical protein